MPIQGAVVLGSNASASAQRAFPVAEPTGALAKAGTGFVSFGSFPTFSDTEIRSALTSTEAFSALVADFRPLRNAQHFGLKNGVDGVFNASTSASLDANSSLVGHSIFLFGGTENSAFVFKSSETFQLDDRPLNESVVSLWALSENELAAGLLLGSLGEQVSLTKMNTLQTSLVMHGSATGDLLDISSMLELVDKVAIPDAPPAESPVVKEGRGESVIPPTSDEPPDETAVPREPEILPQLDSREVREIGEIVDIARPIFDPSLMPALERPISIERRGIEFMVMTFSADGLQSPGFTFSEIPEPAGTTIAATGLLLAAPRRRRHLPCGV
ncbi:MAG: hypothetical protein ACR2OZ_15520 [Verrucomicrobiales bacterium]